MIDWTIQLHTFFTEGRHLPFFGFFGALALAGPIYLLIEWLVAFIDDQVKYAETSWTIGGLHDANDDEFAVHCWPAFFGLGSTYPSRTCEAVGNKPYRSTGGAIGGGVICLFFSLVLGLTWPLVLIGAMWAVVLVGLPAFLILGVRHWRRLQKELHTLQAERAGKDCSV